MLIDKRVNLPSASLCLFGLSAHQSVVPLLHCFWCLRPLATTATRKPLFLITTYESFGFCYPAVHLCLPASAAMPPFARPYSLITSRLRPSAFVCVFVLCVQQQQQADRHCCPSNARGQMSQIVPRVAAQEELLCAGHGAQGKLLDYWSVRVHSLHFTALQFNSFFQTISVISQSISDGNLNCCRTHTLICLPH